MSNLRSDIDTFLAASTWADWNVTPIAGDASSRRYFRLTHGNQSAILMDAPPATCHDTARFVEVGKVLSAGGMCAPDIYSVDLDLGILIMSDLGNVDFATHLRNSPQDEDLLYAAATDTLLSLQNVSKPDNLTKLTPAVGAEMIDVLGTFYAFRDIAELQKQLRTALDAYASCADTMAMRDFHSENLIWRPEKSGTDRVGLLDFQDAFLAPAGYDLASLLRDVRRDVPDAVVAQMTSRYISAIGRPVQQLRLQVAILGVQRNLRILGVFARLAKEGGKTRYLQFMDRVWRHIVADLEHPEFRKLRDCIIDTVPSPTQRQLERILQ